MQNVLVIAYYFPPSGGAGVQRTLKHIQYLRDFGWNPVVLTVANGDFPARDISLLDKIPTDVHVERTHIYEPYDIYRKLTGKPAGAPVDVDNVKTDSAERTMTQRVAEFVRATFFIPDARIGWLWTAVPVGLRLIREYNIQALYNSAPPYTTALIARELKRKTGLRWITCLRDPWTGFISGPKRWWLPAWIERQLERSVMEEADAIECAWEGIVADIAAKYPYLAGKKSLQGSHTTTTELSTAPPSKLVHIPNGFDSSDYPTLSPDDVDALKTSRRFVLTYTGALYGRRNPTSLFAAFRLLVEQGRITPEQVLMRFVGRFGSEIHAMFAAFPFQESLDVVGYVPHEESIRQLLCSHAALLIVDEAKESNEIVPGKVYEYIGAGKPVIAVAPRNSAIERLLDETRAGRVAHQHDIERLADILFGYVQDWKNGSTVHFLPNKEAIARYERRNATKQLADLLSNKQHS
jgi:glycosyltransferase involved in cell wall biosynthesis